MKYLDAMYKYQADTTLAVLCDGGSGLFVFELVLTAHLENTRANMFI